MFNSNRKKITFVTSQKKLFKTTLKKNDQELFFDCLKTHFLIKLINLVKQKYFPPVKQVFFYAEKGFLSIFGYVLLGFFYPLWDICWTIGCSVRKLVFNWTSNYAIPHFFTSTKWKSFYITKVTFFFRYQSDTEVQLFR